MFESLKKLLGMEKTDYAQLVKDGAIILDVRSKREFENGHIKNAINIPVDKLSSSLPKVNDKTKPVITCCASGARSATAKSILKSNGFTNVHNGGAWINLKNEI
jgi:rhodanese-related sulfurtransferase